MAWIESHTNLDRHHKLIRFQTAMRWSRNEAVGFLHRFWWSVLEVSPSGDVTALTLPEVMSETLNMKLDVIQDAILKLEEFGFLDRVGDKLLVHGWLEYAGRYLSESLFKRHPEKMSEVRSMHEREPSEDSPRTVQGMSLIPDRTVPTLPDRTKPKDKNIGPPRPTFQRPSVDEVRDFIRLNHYDVVGETFHAYYESNGWKVGRNPMRDWKAAVRTWHGKSYGKGGSNGNRIGAQPVPGKYANISS